MDEYAFNLYLNWILYAITGRLAEADSLLRAHRASIHSVAGVLRKMHGAPTDRQLYRGILLEPAKHEAQGGKVSVVSPDVTFASYTENHMVASFFADPHSAVSGFVLLQRPDVKGWILLYKPIDERMVLFHWSWAPELPLVQCALLHPLIDTTQFLHSLSTQREVILTDRDWCGQFLDTATIEAIPYDGSYPTTDLNQRFIPPIAVDEWMEA